MRQSAPAVLRPKLCADFEDLDQLCSTVRTWNLDFCPLVVVAERGRVARIVQQQVRDMEVSYARFRASIEQLGAPPSGMLTFGVPETGMRRLWWRGQDLDAQTVLVFPIGGELCSLSGPDFEIHTVSVALETVERLSERFRLPLPRSSRRAETFHPPATLMTALRTHLRRMRDLGVGGDGLDLALLREGLVLTWLQSLVEEESNRVAMPSALVRDRAISACLERIEMEDWEALSPSLLCETAPVSERTLQYAFRERFGLTPAAFLKARRLAAVRRALMQGAEAGGAQDTKVGDIAARFGFYHVGQFAADYRRAFRETPSRTLERRLLS